DARRDRDLRLPAPGDGRMARPCRRPAAGRGLMPVVKLREEGRWTNYHGTGTCEAATHFALRSRDAERGRDEIAIAAKAVRGWLAEAAAARCRVRPLGAGWSPSNVNIASQSWLLHTRRFNRCFRIDAGDVRPGVDAASLMLVEAG